jgi:hypothetical protein
MIPDSPTEKMKATVPTSGGNTSGKAARVAKRFLAGNV